MHVREQVVASIPAKVVGKLCARGRALAYSDGSRQKGVRAQTLELARASWQVSVQAEFKVVQKLAIGRTGYYTQLVFLISHSHD